MFRISIWLTVSNTQVVFSQRGEEPRLKFNITPLKRQNYMEIPLALQLYI